MKTPDRSRIAHMLHYAKAAVRLLGSRNADELMADESAFLSVWKAIEIVGEAANQVSEKRRQALPAVAWSDAIGMRHRLTQGYDSVHPEVRVGTVRDDFPLLIVALEAALEDDRQ